MRKIMKTVKIFLLLKFFFLDTRKFYFIQDNVISLKNILLLVENICSEIKKINVY